MNKKEYLEIVYIYKIAKLYCHHLHLEQPTFAQALKIYHEVKEQ